MKLAPDFLHALEASADRSADPVRMIWPVPGNPVAWVSFATFAEWHDFIERLGLKHPVPEIVAAKSTRKITHIAARKRTIIERLTAGEAVGQAAIQPNNRQKTRRIKRFVVLTRRS